MNSLFTVMGMLVVVFLATATISDADNVREAFDRLVVLVFFVAILPVGVLLVLAGS